MYRHYPASTSH